MHMSKKEIRVQYMLPCRLNEELKKLPLIFLPLAPLEWHGPHMVMGVDPINAEHVALAVAKKVGGVVLPTLYMGTERERDAESLQSLGFDKNDYVIGMNFPKAKGLYKSFYFNEELFSLVLRGYLELCIEHEYKYIYIVNGHGAVNHNEVIGRLCIEFSNKREGVKVAYSIAMPKKLVEEGSIAHAGMEETSIMMHYNSEWVDMAQLPPVDKKLKYTDYSIVDGGGFSGNPGKGHAVPHNLDPRIASNPELGKKLFKDTVADVSQRVLQTFEFENRNGGIHA